MKIYCICMIFRLIENNFKEMANIEIEYMVEPFDQFNTNFPLFKPKYSSHFVKYIQK